MPHPLNASFFATAEHLFFDADEIEQQAWDGCKSGRMRSSLSRSYYSVLLALKERLVREGHVANFPEGDAHVRMLNALKSALHKSHLLTRKFTTLRFERSRADYDLQFDDDDENLVESMLDEADAALRLVDRLSYQELQKIANALQ